MSLDEISIGLKLDSADANNLRSVQSILERISELDEKIDFSSLEGGKVEISLPEGLSDNIHTIKTDVDNIYYDAINISANVDKLLDIIPGDISDKLEEIINHVSHQAVKVITAITNAVKSLENEMVDGFDVVGTYAHDAKGQARLAANRCREAIRKMELLDEEIYVQAHNIKESLKMQDFNAEQRQTLLIGAVNTMYEMFRILDTVNQVVHEIKRELEREKPEEEDRVYPRLNQLIFGQETTKSMIKKLPSIDEIGRYLTTTVKTLSKMLDEIRNIIMENRFVLNTVIQKEIRKITKETVEKETVKEKAKEELEGRFSWMASMPPPPGTNTELNEVKKEVKKGVDGITKSLDELKRLTKERRSSREEGSDNPVVKEDDL